MKDSVEILCHHPLSVQCEYYRLGIPRVKSKLSMVEKQLSSKSPMIRCLPAVRAKSSEFPRLSIRGSHSSHGSPTPEK